MDTGDNATVPALLDGHDAWFGQRIYNNTVDIGAVEADWRPRYGQLLGRNVAVSEASSSVSEEEDAVRLNPGDRVAADWTAPAGEPARLAVRVTGAGVLVVTRDGEELARIPTTGGVRRNLRFTAAADNALAFAFEGESGHADIWSLTAGGAFMMKFR